MRIWVADGERGLIGVQGAECRLLGAPGRALCALGGRIYCAGRETCACYEAATGRLLFDFSLPPGVCALAAAGDSVCALSADADSVTAFSGEAGMIRFCAPAGNYPRSLRASPGGRLLAVAGGAAGEALVMDAQLRCLARYRLPGAVIDVCFLPRGMGALCAVGDGELSARLLRISPRGVTEELCACPLVPSSLCALPDGRWLVGCHGEAALLRPDGRVMLRLPCPYPARMALARSEPLICDPCQGRVFFLSGRTAYRGASPEDALLL